MISSFLLSAKAWIIKAIFWLGRFIWKMIKENPGGRVRRYLRLR